MNKKRLLALSVLMVAVLSLSFLSLKLPTKAQTSNQAFQLSIGGLVQTPITLTLNDVKTMPQVTEYATMYCVDAPGDPLQEGYWTGVPLTYLLQIANVSQSAVKVAFYASDGFTTDLNISTALHNNSILVSYQENNESLSGFRLVVPGCWGYKWISDLTQIQLVNYNFLGTEESLGYADNGISSGTSNSQVETPPQAQATQPPPNSASSSTATQNPTSVQTNAPPTTTVNGTSPEAASGQKSQPLTFVFLAIGVGVTLAAVLASTIAFTRRRKQTAKSSQVHYSEISMQSHGQVFRWEV